MSNVDPRGRFVWHELLTSDPAGAGVFYPKVVSWKTQPWERDPSYALWMGRSGPIGGIASVDDSDSARWLCYAAVEDVHAAVAQAKSMGAAVIRDVTDLPDVGTYAVLRDPQGAEFAVYKSHGPGDGSESNELGDFSWHELCTSDAEAAVRFYTTLLGWTPGPKHDMGPEMGFYHLILHNGNQYAGIYQSDKMPPAWMCYVRVADVDKAANAARAAGGRVINGPMEVPGGSWIAQILDPAGVAFAVHEEKKAAAQPAASEPKPKAQTPAAKPATGAAPAEAGSSSKSTTEPQAASGSPSRGAKPAERAPTAAEKPPARKAKSPRGRSKPASKKVAAKAGRKTGGRAARKAAGKKAARRAAGKKAGARRKAVARAGRAARKTARKSASRKAAARAASRRRSAPAKKKAKRRR